jgi:hypothetical protein
MINAKYKKLFIIILLFIAVYLMFTSTTSTESIIDTIGQNSPIILSSSLNYPVNIQINETFQVSTKIKVTEDKDYMLEVGLLKDGCYVDKNGNVLPGAYCFDTLSQSVNPIIIGTNQCGTNEGGLFEFDRNNYYRNRFLRIPYLNEDIDLTFDNLKANKPGEYDLIITFSNKCYYGADGEPNENYMSYGYYIVPNAILVNTNGGGGDGTIGQNKCYLDLGQSCTLVNNIPGIDDSQINNQCKSGWCEDVSGIGGICSDVPLDKNPHPDCESTSKPSWFKYLPFAIIGGIILLLLVLLIR